MRGIAALVLLVAGAFAPPAAAQADLFTNDYKRVFERHTGETTLITDANGHHIEAFKLPGQILVSRRLDDNGTRYRAIDRSGAGAVYCAMELFITMARMARHCGEAAPGETTELRRALERLSRFTARNRVPPVPETRMWEAVKTRLAQRGDICTAAASAGWQEARKPDPAKGTGARALAKSLDTILAVPRLPVGEPCL